MGAEHVALAGHRGHVGQLGHQGPGRGEVVDHGHLEQQPRHRAAAARRGHSTASTAYDAWPGRPGQPVSAASSEPGAPPSSSPARPRSSTLRCAIASIAASLSRTTTASAAEPSAPGDGRLVARPHRQQRGDRPEQAGHPVGGGEQRAGAVLAVEPELEGVAAGQQRGAVALGLLLLLAQLDQALLEVVEDRAGGLVLGVEPLLAGVEAGDPGLEGGEVALGTVGPGLRLLARVAEPADLLVGRARPRAQRVDLAVQPGQALAAVGGGPDQGGDPPLLLGRGVLGGPPRHDGLLERGAVLVDLGRDRLLLLAHPRRLGLELVGVAAGVDDLLDRAGVADPLGGQRRGAAQPLAQPAQPEPRVLGPRQRGQVLPQRRLEPRLGLAGRGDRGLDLAAPLDQDRLVGELLLQRGARRTRSSAISRARASRTSACTVAACRATSAWRPSGLSWRRISLSRSPSRVRLPSVESSLRSAFSLRLRCLRTPAASSMKPRRSSGVACRIVSSWP